MTKLFTAFLLAAVSAPQAPFEIPPNGKPEVLVGAIRFEGPSALAFDSRNRPYMFDAREPDHFGYILTLRDGKWVKLSYLQALEKTVGKLPRPNQRDGHALGSIALDDSDGLYALLFTPSRRPDKSGEIRRAGGPAVLLYSPDRGKTFQVYNAPGYCLEVRVGHNQIRRPPAIALLKFRKKAQGVRWGGYHSLSVLLPQKDGNRLKLPPPIHITDNCFGMSNHSGGYSFAVTTGRKTHLVYAEIPDKSERPDGGNPTYAATIDRTKRKLIAKEFLVTAPPKTPDVHSTPVIAVDAKGHLHVVAGAHGQQFFYLRSLKPDDVAGGWTKPSPMSTGQTYATLLCDRRDRLHCVYRAHPRLLYQHKPAAGATWSKPIELVRAPKGHKGYTIFYHRLFIDRTGAMYLSFTFFEFKTAAQGRYPRALAVSEDAGKSWRLATTATFTRRTLPKHTRH